MTKKYWVTGIDASSLDGSHCAFQCGPFETREEALEDAYVYWVETDTENKQNSFILIQELQSGHISPTNIWEELEQMEAKRS